MAARTIFLSLTLPVGVFLVYLSTTSWQVHPPYRFSPQSDECLHPGSSGEPLEVRYILQSKNAPMGLVPYLENNARVVEAQTSPSDNPELYALLRDAAGMQENPNPPESAFPGEVIHGRVEYTYHGKSCHLLFPMTDPVLWRGIFYLNGNRYDASLDLSRLSGWPGHGSGLVFLWAAQKDPSMNLEKMGYNASWMEP
jgi:hypothetical protein